MLGKETKKLEWDLSQNKIQKYLNDGLSINTIDGVRGESSLLTHMLSDATGNRLDKVTNEMMLNQRGKSGQVAKNIFSYIEGDETIGEV